MIEVILAIAALMAYVFIGAMIGLFSDGGDDDFGWVCVMVAFWPVAILLSIPIQLAIFIYNKVRK